VQSNPGHLKADVLIVGAGRRDWRAPSGSRAKPGTAAHRRAGKVRALPGGNLLYGAVMRTDALRRLLTPSEFAFLRLGPIVGRDSFHALTPRASFRCPSCRPRCA
jgi:hypothetical protein